MAALIAGVFEENLQKKIVESKVLVVGAGGIGCEVLKNLVLSGFGNIEIVSIHFVVACSYCSTNSHSHKNTRLFSLSCCSRLHFLVDASVKINIQFKLH